MNLIGEHTDHSGGWVLPIAIDAGTTVAGERRGRVVELRSSEDPEPAVVPLDIDDPSTLEPPWARYVGGVVAELAPSTGFAGTVSTTLPVGAGLASSAALEVSIALALGWGGDDRSLAEACRRAEERASGVPCGIMDQLVAVAGVSGNALLIDCSTLDIDTVPLDDELAVVIIDSGGRRALAASGYARRRAEVAAAERLIGPLRKASVADCDAIADPVLRRRALHVVTENKRVFELAAALRAQDARAAGALMTAGHASLRDRFEVSTPEIDALVARLAQTPGVHGARLTGGGWGGHVVALAEPGALDEGRRVVASDGAWVCAS